MDFRNRKAIYLTTLVITFLFALALQMTLPTMPIYLTTFDIPLRWIGLIASLLSLSALASRPLCAWLIHRLDAIWVGVIGAVSYLIVYLVFAFSPDPIWIVFARILQGIGICFVSTSTATLISRSLSDEELLKGMGTYAIFNQASSAIGPYLGMLMIVGDQFTRMFVATAILAFLGTALFIVLRFQSGKIEVKAEEHVKAKLPIYKTRALFPSLVVMVLLFLQSGMANFLSFFARQQGIPNVGFFFLVSFLGLLVARVLTTRIMARYQLPSVFVAIGSLYALMFLGLTLTGSIVMWGLLAIVQGFCHNFLYVVLNTMVVRHVGYHEKASANVLFFAFSDIGYFFGGLIWGAVADAFSYDATIYGSALVIFIGMLLAAYVSKVKNYGV